MSWDEEVIFVREEDLRSGRSVLFLEVRLYRFIYEWVFVYFGFINLLFIFKYDEVLCSGIL